MYKHFILDVDGCLNDGVIYWGASGKPFKAFGNYDHDGLKLLREHLQIEFITADSTGWDITHSRIVEHMRFPLTLVGERERYDFVQRRGFDHMIYMGDGPHDAAILRSAALGIAPAQACDPARLAADHVTTRPGGHGAVFDACVYIMQQMGIEHGF